IQILNDLEFCVQFILPSVHMMKEAELLDFVRLLLELGPVDHRIIYSRHPWLFSGGFILL
ncbi:hypothetical protein M9458_019424, partial [Cirrhinus mrigala]